jgi:hypothetical protein
MNGQQSIPHVQRSDSFGQEVLREKPRLTVARLDELASFYALVTPYFALQTYVRYCEQHPADVLERYGSRVRPTTVTRSQADAEVAVVEVAASRDANCVVAIQPGGARHTWLLTTDSKPSAPEVSRGLDPILSRLSAVLVGGWISTSQMTSLLRDVERATHCEIRPSRVASRARSRSTVDWLEASSLGSVLSELKSKRAFLQSLAFDLVSPDRNRGMLKASLYRSYRVSYRKGDYHLIKRQLMTPLALLLADQAGFLASMPADVSSGGELRFQFQGNLLGNRESHEGLLDTIARLPRLSVSAAHINPYLQLSVVDYQDGSTMTVFSNDPGHLVFLPGHRCSNAAILRVSSQIYSEFASGALVRAAADEDGQGLST